MTKAKLKTLILVFNSATFLAIFRKCDTANTNVHLYVVNKRVNNFPKFITDSFT